MAIRLNVIDNIKAFLILCVVFGHFISGTEIVKGYNIFSWTHYFIYSIHMPMFMFISGILSKRIYSIREVVQKFILPYVLFEFLWSIKEIHTLNLLYALKRILVPTNVYWYILCLGVMKLLCDRIKPQILLPFSVIGSVMISQLPLNIWYFASFGRVLLLLPVFILGRLFSSDTILRLKSRRAVCCVIGLLCIAGEILFVTQGWVELTWAAHNYTGSLTKLLFQYIYSLVFTMGLFLLITVIMPNKNKFFSIWGQNSLLIYLGHMWIVDLIKHYMIKYDVTWEGYFYVLSWAVSVLICALLSMNCWKKIYNVIFRL